MNTLPSSPVLPIHHLEACFDNVTNSYKFYWFISILEYTRVNQEHKILIKDILVGMICNVWYPINHFNLSFGKQDRFTFITSQIREKMNLKLDCKKSEVFKIITNNFSYMFDTEARKDVRSLSQYVPYRFISPWFNEELRGQEDHLKNRLIQQLAERDFRNHKNLCLYRFVSDEEEYIEIQPEWYSYLQQYHSVLMKFCLWHLVDYLQKHNSNVSNIAGKLKYD